MEKLCVCHNISTAINFQCQNSLPKDLYFNDMYCQNGIRMMSERIADVRTPYMVKWSHVIYKGDPRIHIENSTCIQQLYIHVKE